MMTPTTTFHTLHPILPQVPIPTANPGLYTTKNAILIHLCGRKVIFHKENYSLCEKIRK